MNYPTLSRGELAPFCSALQRVDGAHSALRLKWLRRSSYLLSRSLPRGYAAMGPTGCRICMRTTWPYCCRAGGLVCLSGGSKVTASGSVGPIASQFGRRPPPNLHSNMKWTLAQFIFITSALYSFFMLFSILFQRINYLLDKTNINFYLRIIFTYIIYICVSNNSIFIEYVKLGV